MLQVLFSVFAACLICHAHAFLLDSAMSTLLGLMGNNPPWFCHELECPGFTVLETNDKFETRRYQPSVWVATNITATSYEKARNSQMFYKLFHYISGNNSANMKIAMTAPVVTEHQMGTGAGGLNTYIMHFMVPFSLQASPPVPTEAGVYIRRVPEITVYVKQFGGFDNEPQDQAMVQQLKSDVTSAARSFQDNVWFHAGYDGPYSFSNRHNEVWLMV